MANRLRPRHLGDRCASVTTDPHEASLRQLLRAWKQVGHRMRDRDPADSDALARDIEKLERHLADLADATADRGDGGGASANRFGTRNP